MGLWLFGSRKSEVGVSTSLQSPVSITTSLIKVLNLTNKLSSELIEGRTREGGAEGDLYLNSWCFNKPKLMDSIPKMLNF